MFGDRNLDGREQAHAPQYQYDLGVEYRGASGLFARVDFAGLDDFYFDASHDERAPSRVLTHLKAGYLGQPLARGSLGQKPVRQVLFAAWFPFGLEPPDFVPTRYVQAGDPRHAGVTVTYLFR